MFMKELMGLFTGSCEVGTRIKQDTLQQHWKLLALKMGGKNSAIVWDDAQLDLRCHETLIGAFLTAGQGVVQRAELSFTRQVRLFIHDRFHERAKAFTIGHPIDNPFMGPLIDQGSVDRYMKFLGIASREGCEVIMRGKSLELASPRNYLLLPHLRGEGDYPWSKLERAFISKQSSLHPMW